jgi:threonine/homoserine/homoserine lactone efflux protein
VRTFFSPPTSVAETILLQPLALPYIFRDAFIVVLLNPKTAIFFAAFLPQFMGAESVRQNIFLGSIFVMIAAITDTIYALAAGAMAPTPQKSPRVRALSRGGSAGVFLGLGLYTAFGSLHRPQRRRTP